MSSASCWSHTCRRAGHTRRRRVGHTRCRRVGHIQGGRILNCRFTYICTSRAYRAHCRGTAARVQQGLPAKQGPFVTAPSVFTLSIQSNKRGASHWHALEDCGCCASAHPLEPRMPRQQLLEHKHALPAACRWHNGTRAHGQFTRTTKRPTSTFVVEGVLVAQTSNPPWSAAELTWPAAELHTDTARAGASTKDACERVPRCGATPNICPE
mmetsp:Transcript_44602/g.133335  ORF Transcript_44602/g.133335 Transcript_44602/m.133335 type:complete len:211 (+) Transcript_44602:339-971(+)